VDVGAPGPGGPPGYDSPEFHIRIRELLDCYKILLDGTTVGGVFVGRVNEEHLVLERIFVDPNLHKQGIATRSTELTWEMYPEARLWTLGTPEWNVRTKRFYERLGFTQVGWEFGTPEWRGRWYEKQLDPSRPYEMAEIGELVDGMRGVDVEGEVLEKGIARQVRSKRRRWETLTVANAAIGDASGRVVLVLWNEQIRQVKEGDRVRVENGYVSSYRGITQLNVGRARRLIILI
jgi:GNAT superfamily N-acetyltransferase